MSSLHKMPSRLAGMSNPSLESQLAHDFQARANVASGSSTSLGHFGQSTISLGQYPGPRTALPAGMYTEIPPPLPFANLHQESAPTSPYGHAKGVAVSHGAGMGRHHGYEHSHGHSQGGGLPGILDVDEQSKINPMFQLVSANRLFSQTHIDL